MKLHFGEEMEHTGAEALHEGRSVFLQMLYNALLDFELNSVLFALSDCQVQLRDGLCQSWVFSFRCRHTWGAGFSPGGPEPERSRAPTSCEVVCTLLVPVCHWFLYRSITWQQKAASCHLGLLPSDLKFVLTF